MFVNFVRNNKIVAGILAFLRIYLGWQWISGGIGKITGGFDASGFIQGAIANAQGENADVQGWWATFLEHVALPNAGLFSFMVMWGEVLVGTALILGMLTTFAALMGITMNFAFLFSGTVSTNGMMILMAFFILVAGYNAGRFGLDRWVIPFLRKETVNKRHDHKKHADVA